MPSLPPLTAIRAFEAAGRHQNFSRAADELGMTQAAVSYQIKQLETRIGHALFVREKGRVRLSETGRQLLPTLSGAFQDIGAAFEALSSEDQEVLSLTSSLSFGTTWLSARIGRFQLRYPDLAVRLSLSDETLALAESSFDAGLRAGRGQWPGLRCDFLFRLHVTPICTRAFLEANAITRPEDLLPVERFAPNDPWWAGWLAAAGIGDAPPPRPGLLFDSQAQEANAVLAGFGIALMTPLFWRAELDSGRLVQPFETLYMPGSAHWLAQPSTRVGVRKIERFREWLHEELARDRADSEPRIWEQPA